MNGERCNICGEPYRGLANDCACTNYGEVHELPLFRLAMAYAGAAVVLIFGGLCLFLGI